jgi:hypothetical protein
MFSISSHQENAIQNYAEILPYSRQNGYHEENKKEQMLPRIWGWGRDPYTLLMGM